MNIKLDIIVLVTLSGMYYYFFCFMANIEKILELVHDLSSFRYFTEPEVFEKTKMKLNNVSKITIGVFYIITVTYMSSPLVRLQDCKRMNQDKGLHEICGLISIKLPFDIDFTPVKQMIFVVQMVAARFSYVTAAIMALASWEIYEHLVFRLWHVKVVFEHVLREEEVSKRRLLFNEAVRYHQFVLK